MITKLVRKIYEQKQLIYAKDILTKSDQLLIKQHADELKQNIFTFDKPWDMERCIVPYKLDNLDWNVQKNDDEEWCFMLNRMDYLNYLILSDILEKNQTGGYKAKEFILSWINQHKEIKPEPSTRTLDTGIRLMNIFEALPYLYCAQIIDDNELHIICDNMLQQAYYLKTQYLNRYITSNWGSIQTCALVSVLPMLVDNYKEEPLFQWAYDEMLKQFRVQVYADGMHWEQSTMYHIEVLNYGMKALNYLSFYGIGIDEEFKQTVYSLADSLFLQATPSHEIETFGDSDRSNIQDVMTRASVLFNEPEFKSVGFESFDLETFYILGYEKLKDYQNLEIKESTRKFFDGHDSGMYTLRSDWSNTANFTMYINGSLGSGHGHSDNLHVSIYHKGKPILIDSGRLTYREDDPLRVKLKSMEAHNGIIVDDHTFCKPKDSWGYEDFGLPLKNYVRHEENIHYYEGALSGHDPLQLWIRKLVVVDFGIWMIVDKVMQDGKHSLTSRFHVDPSIHYDNGYLGILKMISQEKVQVNTEICSLRYNEPLEHDVILLNKTFVNQTSSMVCFVDRSFEVEDVDIYQDNKIVDHACAVAKKFIISPSESVTIAIFEQEIFQGKKIFFVEGMPFHAKAVVIHEKEGVKKLHRLRT